MTEMADPKDHPPDFIFAVFLFETGHRRVSDTLGDYEIHGGIRHLVGLTGQFRNGRIEIRANPVLAASVEPMAYGAMLAVVGSSDLEILGVGRYPIGSSAGGFLD